MSEKWNFRLVPALKEKVLFRPRLVHGIEAPSLLSSLRKSITENRVTLVLDDFSDFQGENVTADASRTSKVTSREINEFFILNFGTGNQSHRDKEEFHNTK
jgi:hypothetical protein